MDSNELLDALKAQNGIASDYTLARQVLKVDPMTVRAMRKRGLSDERALQIATLLGIDPVSALAAVHAERAKDPEVRKVWESLVKIMASRAAAALGAFGLLVSLIAGAPQPADAAQFSTAIHYAKFRFRRLTRPWAWILAAFGYTYSTGRGTQEKKGQIWGKNGFYRASQACA